MAMAAFDTTRPSAGLTTGRITSLFVSAFAAVAAWNDARITRKSLSMLTARELEDIGLTVGDINDVAARCTR
jgi:uncharacterized protein YjiS (DUF1127 family)